MNLHEELGLGRLPAEDDRDQNYLLRAALPAETPGVSYRYWNPGGLWSNQGATPTCVAHAWVHWLEDGPITRPETPHGGGDPVVDHMVLYDEAQRNDEWDGEDYEGTSVRAGAKVLQSRGFIGSYRWAFDVDTAVRAILTTGPIVLGTWWYAAMFEPDAEGFVKLEGPKVGGHAYVANGVNISKGFVRCKNSWGRDWGKDGYFYMPLEALDTLIRDWGEACLAEELPTAT